MVTFEATEKQRGNLREILFRLDKIPGLLWLPDSKEDRVPLVLIQHPGMSRKEDAIVSGPAQEWATHHGWACLGLDAPGHGERAVADPFEAMRDPEQAAAMAAQFAKEVVTTVDLLAERYPIDRERLGYYGYSLGAMLGIPAVSGEHHFRAAVFAAAGTGLLSGPAKGEGSHLAGLRDVAVRIIAKERDEVISLTSTMELYEGLGPEKDLLTLPGGHFAIGNDVAEAAVEWLASKL
ncbi:MAG: hypothetical protein CL897_06620 [Dehalococcoidia bacterium]|nr:hypothetical protein [Dehalococcoidia bacterium]HCU99880.1 hypothetical protein [Dehalococcoidia bacterium]|tara:strand:- start:313 stop:1020 length:708 start_codon:yes stop_codon:yes gene_type:complete